jgi:N-acetylneuraminate synthase/sialic acid synthase
VIAEVGHNHQGSVDTAIRLFQAAKAAGAHAVKLQKRDNRSLYTRAMYVRPYENENSFGRTYGEHREALEFGRREYTLLKQCADELGLHFFATAFDVPSADFLADVDVPAYKIASGDLTNTPLLRHVARIGKPVIVSTGTGEMEDVQRACDAVCSINPQLALLQCTASYPNEFTDMNLNVIRTYREAFPDVVVGASMHDSGIAMAIVAYVLGGRIIEKHFTLNRAMKGTDHAFSLEPAGLRKMVRDLERARVALGDGLKRTQPMEREARRKMGKSLYAARDLAAGSTLREADIAIKSPGGGLPPYEIERVVGMRLTQAVPGDELISEPHLAAQPHGVRSADALGS